MALGITNFMMIVPLVLFALWGGSLAGRFPKRNLIIVTQTLMLIQAIILGILTWSGIIEIWHVYVIAFLLGAVKAVDMPARHSFVVDMVEGKQDLTNAIGLNSAIYNGARTLGPALAGVAVATMGEAVAFFLNGASFLAVIGSLLMMRNLTKSSVKLQASTSMMSHMGQGVRFVLGQQTLLILMSLVAVSSFLSMPYSTLMPVFADTLLKDRTQPIVELLCSGNHFMLQCQAPEALPLGLLLTCVGIGAVAGALVVASVPERARRGRLLKLGNLCFPSLLIIFVNSRLMILSLVVMIMVGTSFVLQMP